ncbi:hypothetical protein OS493_038537, partial [Desmophyllum pertusum]
EAPRLLIPDGHPTLMNGLFNHINLGTVFLQVLSMKIIEKSLKIHLNSSLQMLQ